MSTFYILFKTLFPTQPKNVVSLCIAFLLQTVLSFQKCFRTKEYWQKVFHSGRLPCIYPNRINVVNVVLL